MENLQITDSFGDTMSLDWIEDGADSYVSVANGLGIDPDNEVAIHLNPIAMKQVAEFLLDKLRASNTVDVSSLNEETDKRTAFNRVALEAAAALDLGAKFNYAKGAGSIIEPRHLIEVYSVESRDTKGETHVLVVGQDADRDGEIRSYRLDRIKGFVSIG